MKKKKISQNQLIILVASLSIIILVFISSLASLSDNNELNSQIEGVAVTSPGIRNVEPLEFRSNLQGRNLIDIRTPQEFNEGKIDGAVNIDFYEPTFRTNLNALDKSKAYSIYCRSGNRTGQTIELMKSMGFQDVEILQGGTVKWIEEGFDLVI